MTDKDKKMLQSALWHISNSVTNGKSQTAECELTQWLKEKFNALPAEQQSEDLDIDEELQRFFEINNLYVDIVDLQTIHNYNGNPTDKIYYFEDVARHFAQLQKERIINKACEWLNKNVVEYHPRKGELRPVVNINAFREAMEMEDEQ
jgi:predicted aldo/keto reductase-like oxidoreductase